MFHLSEAGRETFERLIANDQDEELSRDVKFALSCSVKSERNAEYLVKELEEGGLGFHRSEIEGVIFDLANSPVSDVDG